MALAGVVTIPALACTTAIISAEASGTGRPMLWKHRDTDEYYNHIEYLRGEKYGYTALVNSKDVVIVSFICHYLLLLCRLRYLYNLLCGKDNFCPSHSCNIKYYLLELSS